MTDAEIDDVLGILDHDVPEYRQLYYRWESQQWAAGAIDFSADRRQWDEDLSPELKRSLGSALSSFYECAEQATHALVGFVDAAPSEEQQVFLTTQLVDEARHTVFFDRFYADALGEEGSDMKDRLDRQAPRLNAGFRALLLDALPSASLRIRRQRRDLDALVEGVVLFHLVIESTLGLTGQRFLLNFMGGEGLLPGFRSGFTAVARDKSRHVGFGVRFLKEAVQQDARHADVIRNAVSEATPLILSAIDPAGDDRSYFEPLPYGPEEMTQFALNSLNKRLLAIGIEL
jgi:ribonucleoside-diphosphate reductase beta chain